MVVGPTGGGKSSNVRTLQRALTMLKNDKIEGIKYEKVDIHHLNPKSITMGQLCDLRVLMSSMRLVAVARRRGSFLF